MRDITVFLNEAAEKEWVAISVTTAADHYHDKDSTSQRVVSYDTYQEMKEKGHTKGYMTIKHIEKLSPVCKSKDEAMSYIDVPEKKARKSKINKGDADYIVWCISSGSMNPAGKTKWDWNLWDEQKVSVVPAPVTSSSTRLPTNRGKLRRWACPTGKS